MGTDSLTDDQIRIAQSTQIAELQAQIARLHERLGPDPDAKTVEPDGFPRIVYRAQEDPNPKQLDHPGWDAKKVLNQKALDKALTDGWVEQHGEFVYPDVEEQIAVVKKVTRAKRA